MLEELLGKIGKRKAYSLLLGLLYVLISYGAAEIFFPGNISLPIIFFITLLLVPSAFKLISIEEKIEGIYGLRNFFKEHFVIMEVFMFLFIGIFVGYLIIGSYSGPSIEYQKNFLEKQGITESKEVNKLQQFENILIQNISVVIIAFILSLFFSVGALFLIVLNAGIFASFMLMYEKAIILFSLIHFIPEVFGFLLAAIAGGVVSKAIMSEKVGTAAFRNVAKDASVLLLLSIAVIFIAAVLEVFVTQQILKPLI